MTATGRFLPSVTSNRRTASDPQSHYASLKCYAPNYFEALIGMVKLVLFLVDLSSQIIYNKVS